MSSINLIPTPDLLRLQYVTGTDDALTLVAATVTTAAVCPRCGQASGRIHSRYRRTAADLPWQGLPVRWRLTTRRFFCDAPECPQRIFTEPLPDFAARYAHRTRRQRAVLRTVAYALGGEAGARLAGPLGLPVSPDTLLRTLAGAPPAPGGGPRVLGVDDFAFRRGRIYGTILVDLERGAPIELLPDRRAETLAAWLAAHPGVEIISRDRGGSYADGARQGAPDAQQVADRWHLLKNLAEALEATLAREQQAFQEAARPAAAGPAPPGAAAGPGEPAGTPEPAPARPPNQAERDSAARRERRRGRYEEVMRLYREGYSLRVIAQRTGLARHTVRKYVQADAFLEQKKRAVAPGQLAPFIGYLERRWAEGCHNATQLWRELKELGFRGGRTGVCRFLGNWRAKLSPAERRTSGPTPRRPTRSRVPAPRAVVWWLLGPQDKRTEEETTFAQWLQELCPQIRLARELVQQFFGIAQRRDAAALEGWIERVEASGIAELQSFCAGLRRDWDAVVAGLTVSWSNGPVEGQVNRLKMVKRQMYGRAGFALLRARVLPAAEAA
jgi:transposase